MGIKSGRFTGRNGHEYEVSLVGATVATATIELGIPPATISMAAGEHKFNGFKSTTATVNIITDVPLLELYSAGVTDIRLTIEDVTDDRVEFDGYVTPFAFDQPFTGKNDSVTVNAVDLLTARKDVKYAKIGNTFAIDEYAHDIVGEIARRAGITEIVINLNFNGTADAMYTDSPLNVLVAQAGFLQDEVSEVDALSDICKFFGYTACVVGRTLYLYDEHCLVNAPIGKRYNANVYRRNDAGKWTVHTHYYDQGSPIIDQSIATADIHNDISVTIERAYDGVKISPEGRDVSVLLPDVCADGSYTDDVVSVGLTDESYFDSILEEGDRINVTRRALKSKYLDTTRFAGAGDWMMPNTTANNWENGSILEDVIERRISYDDDTPKSASTSRHAVLWLRMNNPGSGVTLFTQSGEQYSHRNGYVRLTASASGGTYNKPSSTDVKSYLPWLQLYVGGFIGRKTGFPSDLEYQVSTAGYYVASPFIGLQGGGVYPSSEATSKGKTGYIVETGTVNAPIYVAGHRKSGWSYTLPNEVFLRELSVEAVGDPINPEELEHIYAGGEELMEVSSRLTSRKSGYTRSKYLPDGTIAYGVNARPAVVTDTSWKGGYMGRADSENIPISGILLEQLKARYAQPRICYKMTVEGNINPCAAVCFGDNRYTVEAYEKDLVNSTTRIIIN